MRLFSLIALALCRSYVSAGPTRTGVSFFFTRLEDPSALVDLINDTDKPIPIQDCAHLAIQNGYNVFVQSREKVDDSYVHTCRGLPTAQEEFPSLVAVEGHVIGRCLMKDQRCMGRHDYIIEHNALSPNSVIDDTFSVSGLRSPEYCMEAIMAHNWAHNEWGNDPARVRGFAFHYTPNNGTLCQALYKVYDTTPTAGYRVSFITTPMQPLSSVMSTRDLSCSIFRRIYKHHRQSCANFKWTVPKRFAWSEPSSRGRPNPITPGQHSTEPNTQSYDSFQSSRMRQVLRLQPVSEMRQPLEIQKPIKLQDLAKG